MKQYEKYKPSGIDWIGEIPEHWILNKFNRIAFYQEGPGLRNWQFTEDGIKVICVTNITEHGIDFSLLNRCISQAEYDQTYQHFTVQKGDYLLASSGASWGKLAEYLTDEKVFLNTSTIRLNTEDKTKVRREFIKWIIKSPYVTEQLNILLTGSCQPNFGPTHLSQLDIIYPTSTDEQTTIANFLDEKTTQIDKLISNKQNLIELLKEERTSVINEAVSGKGKNWEKKKLKYVMDNFDSIRVPLNGDQRGGGEKIYDYYGASGVIDKVPEYLFDGEYILIGEDGANLLTRSTALAFKATGKFWVNNHAHILRPKKGDIDYYTYLLESIDYSVWVTGSAQPKLTAENLMNISLNVPPLKEQTAIVQHIQTETQRKDNSISKIEKEIELMNEYRTALISEVVMGKIKVTDNG